MIRIVSRCNTLIFLLLVSIAACDQSDEMVPQDAEIDQDMINALENVNEYLKTANPGYSDKNVTVLKKNSELEYKTNAVQENYLPIQEITITAETIRGGLVFWHKGTGVNQLIQIEMDQNSQSVLGSYQPFEIISGYLWALWIPYDLDPSVQTLKYDIIYEDANKDVIRLDPKIRINPS